MQKYMECLNKARNSVIKMIIQFGWIMMLLLVQNLLQSHNYAAFYRRTKEKIISRLVFKAAKTFPNFNTLERFFY